MPCNGTTTFHTHCNNDDEVTKHVIHPVTCQKYKKWNTDHTIDVCSFYDDNHFGSSHYLTAYALCCAIKFLSQLSRRFASFLLLRVTQVRIFIHFVCCLLNKPYVPSRCQCWLDKMKTAEHWLCLSKETSSTLEIFTRNQKKMKFVRFVKRNFITNHFPTML